MESTTTAHIRAAKKWSPRWKLEHMRGFSHEDQPGMISFYATTLHCGRKKAAYRLKLDQSLYFSDPKSGRSPIVFDATIRHWHGKHAKALRENLDIPRNGASTDTLRWKLKEKMGSSTYYSREDVLRILSDLFGKAKALSKFKQAHTKNMIKFDNPPAPGDGSRSFPASTDLF